MLALLGCFASTTETPIVPPVVGVIVIGEYSRVPVLSPTGKVKGTAPLKIFCISLPAVAMIILVLEKAPVIVAEAPRVKVLAAIKLKFPVFNASEPLTVISPPAIAWPLDWLMVRLL